MLQYAGLNIKYEVKDLAGTIDFYNILLGEQAADLYPGHALYNVKTSLLTLTFAENPQTVQSACGNFNLILTSDEEVYERFTKFVRAGFGRTLKADYRVFGPDNHSFSIKDPNGICWIVNIKEKKVNSFKFFNIPRLNSVWDILKPL